MISISGSTFKQSLPDIRFAQAEWLVASLNPHSQRDDWWQCRSGKDPVGGELHDQPQPDSQFLFNVTVVEGGAPIQ